MPFESDANNVAAFELDGVRDVRNGEAQEQENDQRISGAYEPNLKFFGMRDPPLRSELF